MSGADHLAVMLPIKGGAAKVDEPHLGVLHLPDVLPLQGERCVLYLSIVKQADLQLTYLLLSILKHCKNDFNE